MPAAKQMAHLADVFAGLEWWTLLPGPHLLLEQPGAEDVHKHILVSANDVRSLIVAYTPAGEAIHMSLSAIRDDYTATWFSPRSGERRNAVGESTGSGLRFSAPDDEDWLLILQSRP
jgi:hypothetical protein